MVELRRATRDTAAGPGGAPAIGRGYEACDDEGTPLPAGRLDPAAFTELAVVDASPTSAEEREAFKTAAFGVGRPVTLEVADDGVALLDADGGVRAGLVDPAVTDETAALLAREEHLAAWVLWEWLHESGRSAVKVALSRPELMPGRLAAPVTQPAGAGRALLADRRVWLAAAAVVVAVVVGLILAW